MLQSNQIQKKKDKKIIAIVAALPARLGRARNKLFRFVQILLK